jgi:5'-nucleotidase (lipoprotein e(P4) family)
MTLRLAATSLVLGFLTACATPGTPPVPANVASAQAGRAPDLPATVTAPHDQRHALSWVQTSTEYQALALMVFQGARQRLDPVITAGRADQLRDWSAMPADEFLDNDSGQRLAVIFDVDETLVDNWAYQARLVATGQDFAPDTWLAWVLEARARAIPGAVEFTRWLDGRGVKVWYVTNRVVPEREATLTNLRALGFPVDADGANLLVRDDDGGFGKDKVSRRQLVDAEHRVIAMFGDNLGDFLGGVFADNATRSARIANYQAWWGERWYVLPNPLYGSWVDAITGNCRGAATAEDPRGCMDSWGYRD